MVAQQFEGLPAGRARDFLAREKLKYQQVEVGGLKSQGYDRSYLNETIFGADFSGQTLLDVGSYLGYFCLEAMRRGALSATGIEPDADSVRQAREIARLNGLKPDYIHGDFERWDWSGRSFDVVICLNVLHHMYDSVHSLRQIMKLARRKVVLEFAAPTLADLALGAFNPAALASAAAPAIVLGSPRRSVDAASRTFLFSRQAMRTLFNTHTSVFEPVSIRRSPFKGRLILSAVKRRIGHLVVIAGPTSSGKSTLIERMQADPGMLGKLGLEAGPWVYDNAHLAALPNGRIERLALHYDLLRPFQRSIRSYGRDPALDILEVADRVSVFTLMTTPERLHAQIERNEISKRWGKKLKRHRDIDARYADPGFLRTWYGQWAEFVGGLGGKARHSVVLNDLECGPVLHDAAGWGGLYERLTAGA